MCGLTGFYAPQTSRSRAQQQVIVRKMNEAILHRGPDSGDFWQDPDMPLALAHRRLAILDLTEEGAQPKASSSERYIVIYNGEIYNHLSLREELETEGVFFKGRSDTETLLEGIEHWGLNRTLQKITGMYAIVLWDRKERTLHFARDRMGKKPLYIGWAGNDLVFGSELKALRQHDDFKAEIEQESLALYMRYLCVPAPHTIYKHVWMLPPAHRLSLPLENLESGQNLHPLMRPYWSAEDSVKIARSSISNKSETDIIDEFEQHLQLCVNERMISDVPLGAFLSGGIDSSAVTAIMTKASSARVKTYSIGFEEDGYDEAAHAKKIASHLGTDHHEHYCTATDALNVIPMLADMYDEPFADQSAIPTYLVSKFARESVTVALSGDGGDELLGGYTRHVQGPNIWNKARLTPAPLRKVAGAFIPQKSNAMRKAVGALTARTSADLYRRLVEQWQKNPCLDEDAQYILHKMDGLSTAEQLMLWDSLNYLPSDVLTKVDRASMAVALEVRAPLLDHRLFEYVWTLPQSIKIKDGKGKYLLRETLARHVPRELFERPKQGFNIPLDSWLRGELRDWAEDLLDEKTLNEQGLLDVRLVRKTWKKHLKGDSSQTNALWAILMFQAWYKRWM